MERESVPCSQRHQLLPDAGKKAASWGRPCSAVAKSRLHAGLATLPSSLRVHPGPFAESASLKRFPSVPTVSSAGAASSVKKKRKTDAVGDMFLALSRESGLTERLCARGGALHSWGSELGTETVRMPQPRFGDAAGPVLLQSSQTCTTMSSHWFGFKCDHKKNTSDTVCEEKNV